MDPPPPCRRLENIVTYLTRDTSRLNKPEDWEVVTIPLPELRDHDVMIKVKACGVCGTGKSPDHEV